MAMNDNMVVDSGDTIHSAYGEASASELIEIMDACRLAHVPLVIVGTPGVGKTALTKSYCRERGLGDPTVQLLSQKDPTDISGIPAKGAIKLENGSEVAVTDFASPRWQAEVMEGKRKIVFFDEFSCAAPALQASTLTIVGEGVLPNGQKMPDDSWIIMAMNPEDSAVDYNAITPPMANRICFVSYRPTDAEIYEGLNGGWFTDEEREDWSENEVLWRQRIVDFLKAMNGTYNLMMNDLGDGYAASEDGAYNPDNETSSSEREILVTTWCSPRSWDNVARILANTTWNPIEVTAIQERILNGTVGRKATVALVDFVHEHANVDPFAVIKDPTIVNWDTGDEDVEMNDLQEIARAVVERIPDCDGIAGRPTVEDALDFFMKVLEAGGGSYFMSSISQNDEVRDFLASHRPSHIDVRAWNNRIVKTIVAYTEKNYIPTIAER